MKSETGYDAYFAGQLDLAPIVLRKYIINMIAIEGKSMDTVVSYFGDIFWLFRVLALTFRLAIYITNCLISSRLILLMKSVSITSDTALIISL